MPNPFLPNNPASGYALLSFVIIIIFLLLMILIPLYGLSLINVRSASTSQNTRHNFYSTEAAIYDTVGKIVTSDFTWPPFSGFTQTYNFNDVSGQIKIDIDSSDNSYTIDATSKFRDTSRRLLAKLIPFSLGGVPADVILVMDVSGSMNNISSSPPQPLTNAVNAAETLIDLLANQTTDTHVGLVKFSDVATLAHPLTDESNFTSINSALDNLSAAGWTNIGDGIRIVTQELNSANARPNANKFIVLLSDGVANRKGATGSVTSCPDDPAVHTDCTCTATVGNCPSSPHPQSTIGMAQNAHNQNIEIFTVGLFWDMSTNPGSCTIPPHPVCGPLGVARHTLIYSASDAQHYYETPNSEDLQKIYEAIASEIIKSTYLILTEFSN